MAGGLKNAVRLLVYSLILVKLPNYTLHSFSRALSPFHWHSHLEYALQDVYTALQKNTKQKSSDRYVRFMLSMYSSLHLYGLCLADVGDTRASHESSIHQHLVFLQEEGVLGITPLSPKNFAKHINQTLLCFVLLDPQGRHHFCSRYDFGPWPLLPGVETLSQEVQAV